jgi:hypothetical protein
LLGLKIYIYLSLEKKICKRIIWSREHQPKVKRIKEISIKIENNYKPGAADSYE